MLWLTGNLGAAQLVIAGLVVAASLESFFAVCLGCIVFGWLMRIGLVPDDVCEECNNITLRSTANSTRRA